MMTPGVLYPLGVLMTFPLLAYAGYRLGRSGDRILYPVLSVFILFVLSSGFCSRFPGIAFQWMPFPVLYGYVGDFLTLAGGTVIIAAASVAVDNDRLSVLLRILCGILVFGALFRAGFYTFTDYDQLQSEIGEEEVVLQSTSWSCGPAAGSMFLGELGVMASEQDLARIAPANRFTGTGCFQMWNAIGRRAAPHGYQPKLLRPAKKALLDLEPPILAVVELTLLIDHWVVITEIRGNAIDVKNPLTGYQKNVPTSEFFRDWRGIVLVCEKVHTDKP